MYIYNVTTNITDEVHQAWLSWMKKEHIPEMLATGKFTKAMMTRVLVQEETGGKTYSVQYTADSKVSLQNYYQEDAPVLRKKAERFAGQAVSFGTELEIVNEQEVV